MDVLVSNGKDNRTMICLTSLESKLQLWSSFGKTNAVQIMVGNATMVFILSSSTRSPLTYLQINSFLFDIEDKCKGQRNISTLICAQNSNKQITHTRRKTYSKYAHNKGDCWYRTHVVHSSVLVIYRSTKL